MAQGSYPFTGPGVIAEDNEDVVSDSRIDRSGYEAFTAGDVVPGGYSRPARHPLL
jgi:hypothetical protein